MRHSAQRFCSQTPIFVFHPLLWFRVDAPLPGQPPPTTRWVPPPPVRRVSAGSLGVGWGAVRQGRNAGRQWKRRGAGGDPGSRRAAGPRAFSQAHSLVEPLLTSPGLLGPASTQQASGRAELQSEGTPPLPRSIPAIRGAGRDLPASPNTLTTIAERFSHHNTQDRQEWGKQVWLLGAGLRVQDVLAQMGSSCCTDPEGSLPA